jgi:hypothetical protein
MRITMIPGLCSNKYRNTGGSFCESCFASFLAHGADPSLPCIVAAEDDGLAETTLVLRTSGREQIIPLTEERRESLMLGEWKGWVDFVEELPPPTE